MPALHDFIDADNNVKRLRKLLRKRPNSNSRGRVGRTPLHIAVLKCELKPQETDEILLVIRELIISGANVNFADLTGSTPLHYAVMCRNYKVIETLLEAGADINDSNNNAYTALHYATTECSFERKEHGTKWYRTELGVVKLLLTKYPDVNCKSWSNETPLMLAVRDNNYQIVRELIKKKATVDLPDEMRNTALHYAVDREEVNLKIVLELVGHGASFDFFNKDIKDPVDRYLDRLLWNRSPSELQKANHFMKLFLLKGHVFDDGSIRAINLIQRGYKYCHFVRFLNLCHMEVWKMQTKLLSPDWTVHMAAYRLAFARNKITFRNDEHIPFMVLDKLLNELLKLEFPLYCEVITSNFCRSYMYLKFAEICCNKKTGISVFEFDALYSICKYLTNMEMFSIMIVCFKPRRSKCLTRCSIS